MPEDLAAAISESDAVGVAAGLALLFLGATAGAMVFVAGVDAGAIAVAGVPAGGTIELAAGAVAGAGFASAFFFRDDFVLVLEVAGGALFVACDAGAALVAGAELAAGAAVGDSAFLLLDRDFFVVAVSAPAPVDPEAAASSDFLLFDRDFLVEVVSAPDAVDPAAVASSVVLLFFDLDDLDFLAAVVSVADVVDPASAFLLFDDFFLLVVVPDADDAAALSDAAASAFLDFLVFFAEVGVWSVGELAGACVCAAAMVMQNARNTQICAQRADRFTIPFTMHLLKIRGESLR